MTNDSTTLAEDLREIRNDVQHVEWSICAMNSDCPAPGSPPESALDRAVAGVQGVCPDDIYNGSSRLELSIPDDLIDHDASGNGWRHAIGVTSLVTAGLTAQSPIERQFIAALAAEAFDLRVVPLGIESRSLSESYAEHCQGVLVFSLQHPVGKFFADVYLELHVRHGADRHPGLRDDGVTRLVVECDGHNFHDRTKEQASSDRARDRAMAFEGLQVFRFTGSDIFRNPTKCAREALAMLGASWSQKGGA